MHRSPKARIATLLAFGACLALAPLSSAAAAEEAKVTFEHESQPAYEQQLAAGQVTAATFNKRVRTPPSPQKAGRQMIVRSPPHQQPTLAAALQAKHVPVTVLK